MAVTKNLKPLAALPCGCLIFSHDDAAGDIEFCPVHHAAPRLLAACGALFDWIVESFPAADDQPRELLLDASVTMALAEGDSKVAALAAAKVVHRMTEKRADYLPPTNPENEWFFDRDKTQADSTAPDWQAIAGRLAGALADVAAVYGCCQTDGCSIDNPLCVGMIARAALAEYQAGKGEE